MGLSKTSTRNLLIASGGIGVTAAAVYFTVSAMKSPFNSTLSKLPRLERITPDFRNLVYKQVGLKNLYLDIYLPTKRKNHNEPVPTLVFVHGGSWIQASKMNIQKTFRQYALYKLLANGIAVVSINYRLATLEQLHLPDLISDVKDSIRWIHKNGSQYGLDTDRLGVWGSSAGGHLAMMAAFAPNDMFPGDKNLADIEPKVNFLIDSFGPTELNSLFRTKINPIALTIGKVLIRNIIEKRNTQLQCVTGGNISEDKDLVRELCTRYSPINYLHPNCCPTLILHGTGDTTVKISQSEMLYKAMEKENIPVEMERYPKLRHSFCNASPEEAVAVATRITRFVLEQTRNKK